MKTPCRPDPESIQEAQELRFDPPLDEGIREIVRTLARNHVETFESWEGGTGHAYPEPTVRFEGGSAEGPRAVAGRFGERATSRDAPAKLGDT